MTTKINENYISDEMALAAAVSAQYYYATLHYLTSSYLCRVTRSFEITIHYKGMEKPTIPDFIKPTAIEWHESISTYDYSKILTLEMSFEGPEE